MQNEKGSRFFSAARVVLGLTLLWAPLPFAAVQDWAWPTITFLTLLVLLSWALGSIQAQELKIAVTPVFIPIILMFVLGVLQLTFRLSLTPFATRISLLKLSTYIILFFVVMQLFAKASVETWRRVGLAVTAFGSIFSFLSILQFLWNPVRIIYWGHDLAGPFGTYVDRDHYAGLMELILPLSATYAYSRPKRDALRGVLWFAVLVQMVSLLLTGSRGGLISAVVESLILGWVILRRDPSHGKRIRVAAIGTVLVGIAVVFLWLVPPYILARIGTIKNYVPGQNQESRPTLWRNALGIFREHPVFGAGMGSFVSTYPSYESTPSDLITEHAHNDYVETLAETGALGELFLVTAVVMFISAVFRNLRSQLRYERRWLQLGATIGCCGMLVHSFVDFNLQMPANAAWFSFCAALALLSGTIVPSRSGHRESPF